MIIDNLTKFNQKKKMWMTPRHPLFSKEETYKIMYGAAVFIQAESSCKSNPLENFELVRLLTYGLQLKEREMAMVLQSAKEESRVFDYLLTHFEEREEIYFLILDSISVSFQYGEIPEHMKESLQLFRRMFSIEENEMELLEKFAKAAYLEEETRCRELLSVMHQEGMELLTVDLQYYITQLCENVELTQEMLEERNEIRIVEQCHIKKDILLRKGMCLIFDHAQVRIHGNIVIDGGELIFEYSKLIRKADTHCACIRMTGENSRVIFRDSHADCRNQGILIDTERGEVQIHGTTISNTTRGAAIRFFGERLVITHSEFSNCYSPEDGGAVMVHTKNAMITDSRFINCEAKRGGAIYAVEGNLIQNCFFHKCVVAEYGGAVFYNGFVRSNLHNLMYEECCPEGAEAIQYLSVRGTFVIDRDYRIQVSTIFDCPVLVETNGKLTIVDANIYMNHSLHCKGSMQMRNVKWISKNLENADMIVLEHSRLCTIHHCEFNGRGKTSGISATGSRITVTKSLFRNMTGGRAIYNAYSPEISECIFNFCQDGAIYAQNGDVIRCIFVNCRAKSGAGVLMYGKKGRIAQCNFRRCISDFSGGAIDRTVGQQIIKCHYEDCKPNDFS